MDDNTIQRERFPAYKELFQIYTNTADVRVEASRTGDVVERSRQMRVNPATGKREARYRWRIGLKPGDGHHVLLHEVGHVLFDSLDGAEKYLSKVANPRVMSIWNATEDVRIERMTEAHFGKPIWPLHRQQLIDEDTGEPWSGLANMVGALLFNLPVELAGTEVEIRALEHFKDDLIAATFSETPMESAKVALRIAAYMDWLEEVSAPTKPPGTEPKEPGGDDDGDGGSGGSGGGTSSEPSPEPSPSESDSGTTSSASDTVHMGNSPDAPDTEEPDDADDFDGDDMNIVLHAGEKEYTESPELQELLTKTERSIERTVKAEIKRDAQTKKKGPAVARTRHEITYAPDDSPTLVPSSGISSDHQTWMMSVNTESIMLSDNAQFALDNAESRTSRRSRHTGRPTHKMWRLEYGETRVFAKPHKNRGKVVCLVDLSGSMGCWCESCNSDDSRTNSGWLAWQTIAVLSTRFPDMEVFGFVGSPSRNYIVPIPAKQQPMCRYKIWDGAENINGNPDCAALLWLEEYLGLSSNNASAIIISDGMPNGPSPVRCNEISHTREVARRLKDVGVSYASVLVRTSNSDLYPNEITAYVNQPSDICDIQEVLDWMNQR
jgi:hypothetical protein